MNNFTKRMTIAAAALVAAAGMASAQTMKAEIPFSFHAAGAVLAPGGYEIAILDGASGIPLLRIRNAETNKTVLAMPLTNEDPRKEWTASGEAKLSFECGASTCGLVEAWTPGYPAYKFAAPKIGKDEPRRVAVIVMRPEKGE